MSALNYKNKQYLENLEKSVAMDLLNKHYHIWIIEALTSSEQQSKIYGEWLSYLNSTQNELRCLNNNLLLTMNRKFRERVILASINPMRQTEFIWKNEDTLILGVERGYIEFQKEYLKTNKPCQKVISKSKAA